MSLLVDKAPLPDQPVLSWLGAFYENLENPISILVLLFSRHYDAGIYVPAATAGGYSNSLLSYRSPYYVGIRG